jgi:hypothetical protein
MFRAYIIKDDSPVYYTYASFNIEFMYTKNDI